jgi:hypothetical protein
MSGDVPVLYVYTFMTWTGKLSVVAGWLVLTLGQCLIYCIVLYLFRPRNHYRMILDTSIE